MRSQILLVGILPVVLGYLQTASPPAPTTPPFLELVNQDLSKRQQVPFSVSSLIASAVDSNFYKIVDSTTSFVGSNSDALSTVTATQDGGGATSATAARVGLHTGTVNGKQEISIFLAPDLLAKVQSTMNDAIANGNKRGLETRDVTGNIITALEELISPEFLISFALKFPKTVNAAKGLAILAGEAIPVVDFVLGVGYLAQKWSEVLRNLAQDVSPQLKGLPAAIVINPGDGKDQNKCPNALQCSTCANTNQVCTSGPNTGCICEESQCPDADHLEDCDATDCQGDRSGVCNTGPHASCECREVAELIDEPINQDPVQQQAQWQAFLSAVKTPSKPTSPPSAPTGSFYVLALKRSGPSSSSETVQVVPAANLDCNDLTANTGNKYIALAVQTSASVQVAPEQISTNSQGFKITPNANQPVCGKQRLNIVFTGSTSNGNLFTWDDGQGTTGVCQDGTKKAQQTCSDSSGNQYTAIFQLQCQANGNTNYCASS